MSKSKSYISFSADRICHHDDYFLLTSKFVKIQNIKNFKQKVRFLFSSKKIIFMDIDGADLLFLPLIVLRTLWGGKGYALSVRTEYLLQEDSFLDYIQNISTSKYLHVRVKRIMFLLVKNFSQTKMISIHKNHFYVDKLQKYVNNFIYDPQLWDLQFLQFKQVKPLELSEEFFITPLQTVLVAGRFNEQRSRGELLEYIKINSNFLFIIAGIIELEDEKFLKNYKNCNIINRYISNEELFFLMNNCDIIYCFYNNDRPSGFFGRALQLNKPIIVRKNSFLNKSFEHYKKQISIRNLQELDNFDFESIYSVAKNSYYDDSDEFAKIIRN